jgi:hypothetical protein
MEADAEMPDAVAVEEEQMMYGRGVLTEEELNEKYNYLLVSRVICSHSLLGIQTDRIIFTRLYPSMSSSRLCSSHLNKPKRGLLGQLRVAERLVQEGLQN